MKKYIWIPVILLSMLVGCSRQKNVENYKLNHDKAKHALDILAMKKIYFGHQSVGYNIIDGIKAIEKELNGPALNIIEVDEKTALPDTWFAHSRVGKNREPESKCNDFKKYVESEALRTADLVLLKFCYVDINYFSDVDAVFDYYKSTIDSLKAHVPGIRIVHLTVPLKTNETGLKASIKKLIGRKLDSELDNVKRHQFNQMMRKTFGDEMLMDLAEWESTYPDGTKELFDFDGEKIPQLIPGYTSDGGHLNQTGQKYIAEKFLESLATFSQGN